MGTFVWGWPGFETLCVPLLFTSYRVLGYEGTGMLRTGTVFGVIGIRISDSPISVKLTPQETTAQNAPENGHRVLPSTSLWYLGGL